MRFSRDESASVDFDIFDAMEFALRYEAPFFMGGTERVFAAATAYEREVEAGTDIDPLSNGGFMDVLREILEVERRFYQRVDVKILHGHFARHFRCGGYPAWGMLP